jgi:hypothetical protein
VRTASCALISLSVANGSESNHEPEVGNPAIEHRASEICHRWTARRREMKETRDESRPRGMAVVHHEFQRPARGHSCPQQLTKSSRNRILPEHFEPWTLLRTRMSARRALRLGWALDTGGLPWPAVPRCTESASGCKNSIEDRTKTVTLPLK